jgi:hypothetical protein
VAWAVTLVAAIPPASRAQNTLEEAERRDRLLAVGMQMVLVDPPHSARLSAPAAGLLWSDTIQHAPNVEVSVHVRVAAPAGVPPWKVRVLNVSQHVVEELPHDHPCWANGACWTLPVARGEARIELWSDGPVDALEISLDAYVFPQLPSEAEGTVDADDKKELRDGPEWLKPLALPVARLAVTNRQSYCTGFLVSPTLIITNQHCVANDADALSTLAEFKFEKPRAAPERVVRVHKLELADAGLDYAILRLEKNAGATYGRVSLAPLGTISDQNGTLAIVQHPNGRKKMVAADNCAVVSQSVNGPGGTKTDFSHSCDTLRGSSGSPVFTNPGGVLVGLHHWGFDESGHTVNQAVFMSEVLADLRHVKNRSALADEMVNP